MKIKRYLTQIWLLGALLLALPAVVQAQYNITNNGDGTCAITKYTGAGGAVVISSTLSNLRVTSIGNSAFYFTPVTSVTIPNSVTNIGAYAFEECTELTTATIGYGLLNIGGYAFSECGSLTSVYCTGNAPSVGVDAFYGTHNMTVYYYAGTSGWGPFPATIEILNAPDPNGSLQVIIAPDGAVAAGAYWQVDGGVPQPSGATVVGLSVANHTVSFSTVSGWTTPADEVVSVSADLTAETNGTYVVQAPPEVTTTALPNGTNGLAYSQQLSASYGQPPFSWSLISGSLPSRLTLATNGLISGTPTNNGTFNFTVQVTDTLSETATQALAIAVGSRPSAAIQPTNNPVKVAVGTNVTLTASVVGTGPFSYQWQLNGTNLPNGIITTLAGNGYTNQYGGGSFSGDGGAATSAELNYPEGVAVDAFNNVFIGDQNNERIRRVGANGIITTVAGNGYVSPSTGYGGYSGDGGAATNAALNEPEGVAVDASGNLFIADIYNNRIRKVGVNGIITTVAGNGPSYPTNGGYSGDGGAATNAALNNPRGVAVDAADNLFIADGYNDRIREVGTNGIITTVAGNGTNNYSGDGGAATNAELNNPYGVLADRSGNLFIADAYNERIRMVGTNGIITTVAGGLFNGLGDGGAATNAQLAIPGGVAVDSSGNLFIADSEYGRIRMVATNGIITTVAGNGTRGYSGDGGAATNAALYYPLGVAVDAAGNLLIADYSNHRIRKVFSPGVPGPTLVLNDFGFGNAGAYDVVVSSPYGSVTSSVVNLTISLPLVLSMPQKAVGNTNFTFLLSGPSGSNYVLQVSMSLANWSPVSGSINLSNPVSGSNRRFYRAYLQ